MENLTQNTEPTPAAVPPATPRPNPEKPNPEKQRSEAQIAASRANGAKSKGPKTPEGKRIASLNAERHGLLSRLAVMDGEDQAGFLQLSHNLIELFQPADEHEANLVETMLTSIWRRTRAIAMETCGFSFFHRYQTRLAVEQNNPGGTHFDLAFAGLSASLASNKDADARALELLHRYEIRHTRAYNRAVKDLFAYRKLRGLQPIPTFDQSAAEQATAPTSPATQPESFTPNQPQAEPRAQASGPQLPTNAAAPLPPQPQSLPNEPKPTPTATAPQPSKPHANHPARNQFKKNRKRK